MDVILGSAPGFTSRVPKRLRDEQGLAYSTFANITSSAGLDPGRFVAYIGTSPENRQRAIDGILGEIRLLVEKGVTEAELRDARQYLTGSFVFHFQTNAQVTHFMVLAKRYGIGFDYAEKFPVLINAVSLEDVARVAKQYLHPDASTVVVVGPRE
jgi:zinc protease